MAQNRIQFQPGMSMPEFIAQYGTEEQFAAALEQTRWPDGFRCPRCGSAAHGVIQDDRAKNFQCKACRHQTTLPAGTVKEATKLPLTTWFLAIYLPDAFAGAGQLKHGRADQDRSGGQGLSGPLDLGGCHSHLDRPAQPRSAQSRWRPTRLRGRSVIEALIGYMKADVLMDRNWLNGNPGEAMHVPLCAPDQNLRLLLWAVAAFLGLTVPTLLA